MRIHNVHERVLHASSSRAAALLDGLASPEDRLWPKDRWPPMRLDRPIGPGASGGHGPIRYNVEIYEPGRRVVFRFTAPAGFHGTHAFELLPVSDASALIRHTLTMNARGSALLTWPLVFRPLHDALIEDAFDRASEAFGGERKTSRWSWRVRQLRRILRVLGSLRRKS